MNRRQFLQGLLLSPLGIIGASSCSIHEPLHIGTHPWPGYETLLLARQFSWFDKNVFIHEGTSASDSISGLKKGHLNAACLTLDEVLSVRAIGLPLTVVLVFDISAGADVVLAKPNILSPSELKGKRLALEKGPLSGLVLQKMLDIANLKETDLVLVDAPLNTHVALWKSDQIDAAITYPPFSSLLIDEGASGIFDTRQMPNKIFDVFAVRSDQLKRLTAPLLSVVSAHFRVIDYLSTNSEDAMRRIAGWRNIRFEDVVQNFSGLHIPNRTKNQHLLTPERGLIDAAKSLNNQMLKNGLQTKPDNLVGLVSKELLTERT